MDLKGSVYWNLFRDCWDFFKGCLPAPSLNDAERWDAIVGTAGQLMNKYRRTEIASFGTSLVLAVIDELARLSKNCQIEVKGDEQHGTSAEIPRSAAILDNGGASEKTEGEGR